MGDDFTDPLEPPGREPREHLALARDRRGQDHVQRGDAIRCHDEQVIAQVVDVAHLAGLVRRG